MERNWTDRDGMEWTIRPRGDSVVFSRDGRSHVARVETAGSVESLEDEELHRMFDDARSEDDAEEAGDEPSSPSAMGHQSAPHVDLAGQDHDDP